MSDRYSAKDALFEGIKTVSNAAGTQKAAGAGQPVPDDILSAISAWYKLVERDQRTTIQELFQKYAGFKIGKRVQGKENEGRYHVYIGYDEKDIALSFYLIHSTYDTCTEKEIGEKITRCQPILRSEKMLPKSQANERILDWRAYSSDWINYELERKHPSFIYAWSVPNTDIDAATAAQLALKGPDISEAGPSTDRLEINEPPMSDFRSDLILTDPDNQNVIAFMDLVRPVPPFKKGHADIADIVADQPIETEEAFYVLKLAAEKP